MTEPRISVHMSLSGTLTLANFMKIAALVEPEKFEAGFGNPVMPEVAESQVRSVMTERVENSPEPEQTEPDTQDETVEIDAHGHPWSEDIHASTKTQTKDGLWRLKPGASRPDPMPGFPKGETPSGTSTPSPASTDAGGATEPAGSSQTEEPASVDASQEDDEFAAFREAAAKADAADTAAAQNVPERNWTDADLGSLCNQAAVKLGDPAPVKELIAEFVPAGEVAHSRNVPADKREDFAKAVEAKAGIEFAG